MQLHQCANLRIGLSALFASSDIKRQLYTTRIYVPSSADAKRPSVLFAQIERVQRMNDNLADDLAAIDRNALTSTPMVLALLTAACRRLLGHDDFELILRLHK